MAYQPFFYRLMIPYLVTWYACFFHPLFVGGPALMPWCLAIALGIFFLLLTVLANQHIERAGFHMVTHGMDVYTMFPEEGTLVYGKVYGYIRRPLYFSLTCGCIALGLFRNNAVTLVVSILHLIPAVAVGVMEDRELTKRNGKEHEEYIQRTAALVPLSRMGGFLKLLFFLEK